MEATWEIDAGEPTFVHLRADLARGTTVWLDGRRLVEDTSWAVERTYAVPIPGHVAALTVTGTWPFPTRAELRLDGAPARRCPAPRAPREPPRPIPWWGRASSGVAIASLLTGLFILPISVLFSFAALRVSRSGRGLGARIGGAAAHAIAPWLVAFVWHVVLVQIGGVELLVEGGWTMYPILILGLACVTLGLAHAIQAHRLSAIRGLAAVVILSALGVCGTWSARREAGRPLATADPADVDELRSQLERESSLPRQFALAFAAASIAAGAAGEARRIARGRAA